MPECRRFIDHCMDDDCPIWTCRVCGRTQSDHLQPTKVNP